MRLDCRPRYLLLVSDSQSLYLYFLVVSNSDMEKKDTYRSQFRLPQELYVLLKESAEKNRRNLNAELIFRLNVALSDERLDRYLAQQKVTREEFEANAKAVERAFPAQLDSEPLPDNYIKDDLDEAISRLNSVQRRALLKFICSMISD